MHKRERISRNPSELWQYLLEEADGPGTLIVVNNLLMEREVRRKWQRNRKGFAPDIQTLASFLDEMAIHAMHDADLPALILAPQERTLWLEQWLSNHDKSEYRRFAGLKTVTAISNIIGDLYRCSQRPGVILERISGAARGADRREQQGRPPDRSDPPGTLSREKHVLAEILHDYELQMQARGWLDQERLALMIPGGPAPFSPCTKAILYQVDEITPAQDTALSSLSGLERVSIRFDDRQDEPIAPSTVSVTEASACGHNEVERSHHGVYLDTFHHPREELEQTVRQILALISGQDRVITASSRLPGFTAASSSGKKGASASSRLRYDDFVILTGDLSLYEPMVPSFCRRYEIPLYTSRGPSLISQPFIRRILTYLKLGHSNFKIDDVFRIFSDNRLLLPDLQDNDELKMPNIRHFSQFCREYNFRTLDEAADGMDRVFDWLFELVRFDDDDEKEQKRREQEQRNRDFYHEVVGRLQSLREYYRTNEHQTLSDWAEWAGSLLALQKNLKSREANEAREILRIILDKLALTQERLGLSRKMGAGEFFRLLELRLKETRERPTERPGGVLLTEIGQLPEVHDKIVFILGLHEEGFPKTEKADFLQFRYEKILQDVMGRSGTESYDLARMQLQRVLASGCPRYIGKPNLVAQKQVMPSPLWLELMDGRGEGDISHWPVTSENWIMSSHEAGRFVAAGGVLPGPAAHSGPAAHPGQAAHPGPARHHEPSATDTDFHFIWKLAFSVEKERQDTTRMGPYDGVLDPPVVTEWLRQQFGDGPLRMSISRLDTYATSPQEYLFKYVLRLKPLHEYQDDAESNVKGSLLHHILQDFYSKTEEEGPPVWPADDFEAAQKRMNRIRRRLVDMYRHQLGNPESPFPGILENNLEQVTRWFLDMEASGPKPWLVDVPDVRPAVFYPAEGYEMEHPWAFDREYDGFQTAFSGKIDRIDINEEGSIAMLFDYKSGKSGSRSYSDIVRGTSFQLPVYAMYLRSRGISRFVAGYYKLPVNGKRKDVESTFSLGSAELIDDSLLYKKDGNRRKNSFLYKDSDEMDDFMQAIEERRIKWILRAIRKGCFNVSLTGDPAWSDYRHISRYEFRIQLQRRNREAGLRTRKKMTHELDRYYLYEPFWEDAQ